MKDSNSKWGGKREGAGRPKGAKAEDIAFYEANRYSHGFDWNDDICRCHAPETCGCIAAKYARGRAAAEGITLQALLDRERERFKTAKDLANPTDLA